MLLPVIALSLPSCLPVSTRQVPQLLVTIRRNGAPLRGAKVEWLGRQRGHFLPMATGVTDYGGRAAISKVVVEAWEPLLGDKIVAWQLRAYDKEQVIVLWQQSDLWSAPSELEISCDVVRQLPCKVTSSKDARFPASDALLPISNDW